MSFDIHIMAFQDGEVCDADQATAKALVDSLEHQCDERFSAYNITLPDGATVEMYASGLHTGDKPFQGSMITLRGLSDSICQFIYDFTAASACVAIPTMDPGCILVPNTEILPHIPDELNNGFQTIMIQSGADVAVALYGGFEAWSEFRDRVVDRDTSV